MDPVQPRGWQRQLVRRFQAYADGHPDSFSDVPINLEGYSPFQQRVLLECRRIAYGCTISYAQLAARAGAPRAARAVGNVMAQNRLPILIPCHRVIASNGSLGGYSGPHGLRTKRRLLELEGAAQAGTSGDQPKSSSRKFTMLCQLRRSATAL